MQKLDEKRQEFKQRLDKEKLELEQEIKESRKKLKKFERRHRFIRIIFFSLVVGVVLLYFVVDRLAPQEPGVFDLRLFILIVGFLSFCLIIWKIDDKLDNKIESMRFGIGWTIGECHMYDRIRFEKDTKSLAWLIHDRLGWSLIQEWLTILPPEKRKSIEEEVKKIEEEKKEAEDERIRQELSEAPYMWRS